MLSNHFKKFKHNLQSVCADHSKNNSIPWQKVFLIYSIFNHANKHTYINTKWDVFKCFYTLWICALETWNNISLLTRKDPKGIFVLNLNISLLNVIHKSQTTIMRKLENKHERTQTLNIFFYYKAFRTAIQLHFLSKTSFL